MPSAARRPSRALSSAARRAAPHVVALGLLACGGSVSTPNAEPATSPDAPPRTEAEAPRQEAASQEAQLAIDAALADVARLRELAPRAAVRGAVVPVEQLVSHVQSALDEDLPEKALTGTAELLWALGTVPDGFDYRESVLALMSDELAGLYDPEQKAMYLRRDLGADATTATLAHELVHALQDQHYGLEGLTKWRDDATDQLSALSALAEGDAMSAMLDGMLESDGRRAFELPSELLEGQMRLLGGVTEDAQRVPTILKRSLIAPYADGIRFVHALRKSGGWAAVDGAWRDLPTTTEQILHPDKYEAREPALAVTLPPAPPAVQRGPARTPSPASAAAKTTSDSEAPPAEPWQLAFHDVWGEQSLRILFEEWMPYKAARESGAGWGGDRIALYRRGEERAVAWSLLADDDASAERMLRAFARGVHAPRAADTTALPAVSDEQARSLTKGGATCELSSTRGPFSVVRRGRHVVVVVGPYEHTPSGRRATSDCAEARRWAEVALTIP